MDYNIDWFVELHEPVCSQLRLLWTGWTKKNYILANLMRLAFRIEIASIKVWHCGKTQAYLDLVISDFVLLMVRKWNRTHFKKTKGKGGIEWLRSLSHWTTRVGLTIVTTAVRDLNIVHYLYTLFSHISDVRIIFLVEFLHKSGDMTAWYTVGFLFKENFGGLTKKYRLKRGLILVYVSHIFATNTETYNWSLYW